MLLAVKFEGQDAHSHQRKTEAGLDVTGEFETSDSESHSMAVHCGPAFGSLSFFAPNPQWRVSPVFQDLLMEVLAREAKGQVLNEP